MADFEKQVSKARLYRLYKKGRLQLKPKPKIMKNFLSSKTLWVNVIALIALILQLVNGFVISAESQIALITVINLILRFFTGTPLTFGRQRE